MLKYAEKVFVVLGDQEPPFNENFKKGDIVLIEHHCDNGNPHNEHYTVSNNHDFWWIVDSEIDHAATEQLKKEKKDAIN